MNRFTKDMATIDDMLPLVLFDLIQVSHQHRHCCAATDSYFERKKITFLCVCVWFFKRQNVLHHCSV